MKAAVYERYGPAEVVEIRDIPRPEPAEDEVLVRVAATSVTTADWRLRASVFPGGLWLVGRLMTGLFSPRKRVLGGEFAGTVATFGKEVTDFDVGAPVFGFAGAGAHAEYLTMNAKGAITRMPNGLEPAEAAALPFGALAALVFLRDIAQAKAGQSILILGASGNVGVYAVQIAKAMGTSVTAVASQGNHALLKELGADHVIDCQTHDPFSGDVHYDFIMDPAGFSTFKAARKALTENGVYVPLNFGIGDVVRALVSRWTGGQSMRIGVNGDTREDLDRICEMVSQGQLRPVVDRTLPLDAIRDAYAHVEGRHRRGSVVFTVEGPGAAISKAAG
ncbi:MAG: NAD(P)-dependent alcohol dehydrogenase [Paracoccaceae bacterium]|nr:NAD(P)-dependent alcohol dehydrogenase [Paracoccaceae bacterium]